MDKLSKEIESLKKKLNKRVLYHCLLDPKTIKLSKKLDKLIAIKQKEKLNADI